MAEGNDTPGGGSSSDPPEGRDLDFLAARRARRAEMSEPTLVRRAEVAEATVRTMETHMASLQTRLRELEEEQRRTAEQLGEREHEMRRVKQREYAEQQLRVEAEESRERLGREHRAEVDRLSRRLSIGERHARELADQLESARRELAEAEQTAAAERAQLRRTQEELVVREADLSQRELALDRTRSEVERRLGEARDFERQAQGLVSRAEQDSQQLAARLAELEGRAGELQQGLQVERAARERSEQSLLLAQQSYARLERIVTELKGTAVHLRDAVERERHARVATATATAAAAPAPVAPASAPVVPEEDALRRAEMAEALAAAVERLRARVAEVGERQAETAIVDETSTDEAEPVVVDETPPAVELKVFEPRVLAASNVVEPWLAPAIRKIAELRDAKLAAELIVELLPAQCLVLDSNLTYRVKIEELGFFEVRLRNGYASVGRLDPQESAGRGSSPKADFVLEGHAAAFSELAAGGSGRRFAGLRVSGGRRRARRLLAARRAPVGLAALVSAQLRVWPGLLLLALAEAIEPQWTTGSDFVVAFAIGDSRDLETILYVRVRDGEQIVVTRVRGDQPDTVVHTSERSFLRVLGGLPLAAGEQLLIEGDSGPLEQLIGWADRAQGRSSAD